MMIPKHTLERSLVSIRGLQFRERMQDIAFPMNTNPNFLQDDSSQNKLWLAKETMGKVPEIYICHLITNFAIIITFLVSFASINQQNTNWYFQCAIYLYFTLLFT